ncbi:EH signature domain-containing protein [Bradyrhizobium sp. WD16]|uniref:EH signature domain-containing protein n=1 Tax=Bradyrhizobium sp. WD16 TaxID=1521768 RepID=UPI0020A36F3B|nr:EH signature domain-containing protein [Bradyrhizobium sp. WD16]UTD26367.1 hypothetical protein DB459_04975 [Bradyrhizobium sp. WD16]
MSILAAINSFSPKRLESTRLAEYGKLIEACSGYRADSSDLKPSRATLEAIVSRVRTGSLSLVSRRELRVAISAIGLHEGFSTEDVLGLLTEASRRRDKRCIRASLNSLFFCYRDKSLRDILRAYVRQNLDQLMESNRRFCKLTGILEDNQAVNSVATSLLEGNNIHQASLAKGLSTFILSTAYGIELKLACIRLATRNLKPGRLEHALSFAFDNIVGTPPAEFYEALVDPFLHQPPPPDALKKIVGALISRYRDPRLYMWPILLGKDGQRRRDECLVAVRRWLSIEYLDLFIRIIEETADDQFMPRKKFWLRYFEKGHVTDLTLILASDAGRVAKQAQRASPDTEYMKWSHLTGANSNQSVLLMRLGDLVIAEWSHSGALRFWRDGDKGAPEFHKPTYVGQELRRASMEVRIGDFMRDAIRHDKNGSWTTWARRAIEHHTGIRA